MKRANDSKAGRATTDAGKNAWTRKHRMKREPKSDRPISGNVTSESTPPDHGRRSTPRWNSKIATVIALLEQSRGATLAELVAATSWQPHTVRASLTGLRKKGHAVTKGKRDAVTCYHITKSS